MLEISSQYSRSTTIVADRRTTLTIDGPIHRTIRTFFNIHSYTEQSIRTYNYTLSHSAVCNAHIFFLSSLSSAHSFSTVLFLFNKIIVTDFILMELNFKKLL